MPPDLAGPVAPRPLAPLATGIKLRDVWFRHSEGHQWILRGVRLTIPYGATVALVGLNDAGKSTLELFLRAAPGSVVPPDRMVVLGDNASLSYDSRHCGGPDNLVGMVVGRRFRA